MGEKNKFCSGNTLINNCSDLCDIILAQTPPAVKVSAAHCPSQPPTGVLLLLGRPPRPFPRCAVGLNANTCSAEKHDRHGRNTSDEGKHV